MPGKDGKSHISTDRESAVGEPVVRDSPALTGEETVAVRFDPDDPESVDRAAEIVTTFFRADAGEMDSISMLQGAAACAVVVRGEGSYKEAAERGEADVTVSFIRMWARVHDLPRAVRRHVAKGDIAPSAAKHIARLTGKARLHLAWAAVDHDLTVREIRTVVRHVQDGDSVEAALEEEGYELGEITLTIPPTAYCLLRQRASLAEEPPGDVVATLFDESEGLK